MNKDSFRKDILSKLSLLSFDEIQLLNSKLTDQLIRFLTSHPELTGQIGASYLPLKSEVAPLYQELLHRMPLNLAFPVLQNGEMLFAIPHGMPKGSTWLMEPYHLANPEWLLVPGVGFDLKGGRLGRGKGYYDRYLEQRKHVPKIGLCWTKQMVEKIPVEAHDCHMDFIITEEYCWNVKQQEKF